MDHCREQVPMTREKLVDRFVDRESVKDYVRHVISCASAGEDVFRLAREAQRREEDRQIDRGIQYVASGAYLAEGMRSYIAS